jgi:hypothetical protein
MAKLKDDPDSEALIAAGYDPEAEVVDFSLTPEHIERAMGSLERAAKNKKYAAQLKDEFLMYLSDPGASALPREGFAALCACFRQGLENPKGRIAELMKKSGFDSPEALGKIDFDLTPEQ